MLWVFSVCYITVFLQLYFTLSVTNITLGDRFVGGWDLGRGKAASCGRWFWPEFDSSFPIPTFALSFELVAV